MVEVIKLGEVDSIEARRANIRDEIEKAAAKSEAEGNAQSAMSFRLAGDLIISILNAHQTAFDAGVTHEDFMERIFPCALASATNTTVRNTLKDKRRLIDGINRVLSKAANYAMSQVEDDND